MVPQPRVAGVSARAVVGGDALHRRRRVRALHRGLRQGGISPGEPVKATGRDTDIRPGELRPQHVRQLRQLRLGLHVEGCLPVRHRLHGRRGRRARGQGRRLLPEIRGRRDLLRRRAAGPAGVRPRAFGGVQEAGPPPALDTTGSVRWEVMRGVLPSPDLFLCDLEPMVRPLTESLPLPERRVLDNARHVAAAVAGYRCAYPSCRA